VDANLRPEGKNGPLVRTLASYAAYYRRWAAGWEAQLRYAAGLPGLRTTRTLPALRAAAEAGLLTRDDADALEAASRVATREAARDHAGPRPGRRPATRARPRPGRGRPRDGLPPGRDPGQVLEDYRRATRRARRVVERVFYA